MQDDGRYFIAKGKHLVVPVKKQEYEEHWNKKRKEPITNDQWRKTCSAEEFAEWITDKINAKVGMALHDAELYDGYVNENEYMENEDEWLDWLNEVHK